MITVTRLTWMGLAALFVVLAVAGWPWTVDSVAQARYSAELRRVESLDARLDYHVLRSRAGLVTTYDPFIHTFAELAQARASLHAPPGFLSAEGRRQVLSDLEGFEAALREKEDAIEDFKTENAILRNSLRYFPIAAADLTEKALTTPGGSALIPRAAELTSAVLLFSTLPDPELRQRVLRGTATLANAEGWEASPEDGDVGVLLQHARVIAEKRPLVDALGEAILALPTRRRAEALDADYAHHYVAAITDAAAHRLVLFAVVLAAVGAGALDFILRLRRSAAELERVSGKLREANGVLRRDEQRAKELSELKTRFASMTAHEFRTPLSIIMSSSELLESYGDRWPPAKKAEHFARIHGAVTGMTRLLQGILFIGRAEAGMLALEPTPVDLEVCCAALIKAARASTPGQSPVRLTVSGERRSVEIDEQLLTHVLLNLLSNAIKYSPGGAPIDLLARAGHSEVSFEVRDAGIGIPAEDQPRLFEGFHRGKNALRTAGSGLGLAVVKAAVEVQGGTIRVESALGAGTRVLVILPVGPPS